MNGPRTCAPPRIGLRSPLIKGGGVMDSVLPRSCRPVLYAALPTSKGPPKLPHYISSVRSRLVVSVIDCPITEARKVQHQRTPLSTSGQADGLQLRCTWPSTTDHGALWMRSKDHGKAAPRSQLGMDINGHPLRHWPAVGRITPPRLSDKITSSASTLPHLRRRWPFTRLWLPQRRVLDSLSPRHIP